MFQSECLKERLHQASTATALDTPGVPPWHLLLSVQYFDAKGMPTETGMIEEWWAAPDLNKVVYTSPTYSGTEVHNKQGFYETGTNQYAPELQERLRLPVTHPMPEAAEINDATPDLRKHDFAKVPLDASCSHNLLKDLPFPPLGLFPTCCFDPSQTWLRATFDFGSMFIARNRMGTFQGKSVPMDETISFVNVVLAKAHIEKLGTSALTDADVGPGAGMGKVT